MADRLHDRPTRDECTHVGLSIGHPEFGRSLLDMLRRTADVGHCMVFALEGERSTRCALDLGNIAIGPDLGSAYSEHFHLSDPNRDALFEARSDETSIILPTFARRMYNDRYRRLFFDESAIVDKFAAAVWIDDTCYYVNLYRSLPQGRFNSEQREALGKAAPGIVSAVAQHCRAEAANRSDPFVLLEDAFTTHEPLLRLTKREREVCLRILSGLTSEGISSELGVSLQSTLTYRKRAYDKLGISSQSELFKLAIRSLVATPRLN
ncbi:LuxR family transcriptional regulator [Tardiphaga alba]|uniref:LuxR family transcriptional regulator n=1 Tax=Tardiphaga alba TaxID=340268 RepID=A0ABX8A8V1_9BRAD|nr:helix-turn-helix transcriptional regulator [Tardiphaga alba]QUS39902.1 LuxR family transcriptional regulator [Tardiphaga alba]